MTGKEFFDWLDRQDLGICRLTSDEDKYGSARYTWEELPEEEVIRLVELAGVLR